MPPFDTVLVANRGEIARRVIRTLRALGIRSVAVYSDPDAAAPHVREADEAVRIGPAAAAASYLNIDAILAAARDTGAQAIHPGYGFLSENAAFGRACTQAGIVFIGPGPLALDVMADKIRARDHVAASGVPIVPGFSAAGMSDDDILAAASTAGFPLLIKPSAGGGGKGMQELYGLEDIPQAVATARRIATAAFGDDTLLFERLIQHPRHIEVQVLGDAHGAVIHLGERECSLQRRHQKVVEESPSPLIDAETRARLGRAACAAAASVDYTGAGTVEFIVSADRPDEFFFMEMNTRLQVEHPVTELVTGIDLVEQQLWIAAGEPLGLAQDDVRLTGHAVEARVYAERPSAGFLPATGEVLCWRPADGVRTDAAVETGTVISTDYDPMIAKVIAHAPDRAAALARLDAALAGTVLLGVDSNIAFLRALIAEPSVQAGTMTTELIDALPPFVDPEPAPAALRAAAGACDRQRREGAMSVSAGASRRAGSRWRLGAPAAHVHAGALWHAAAGWRLSAPAEPLHATFALSEGKLVDVDVDFTIAGPDVRATGVRYVPLGLDPSDPMPVSLATAADGTIWVHAAGVTTPLLPLSRREAMVRRLAQRERAAGVADPDLRAPMPGAVVAVHVGDGDHVTAGARLLTIEAMKMEHPVTAPHDGVARVSVTAGDQVRRDQIVARVVPDPPRGD